MSPAAPPAPRTLPGPRAGQAPAPVAPDPDTPAGRLFNAARELFARDGFSGATTRAIAVRAGQNQALLHYYHGSKAALYRHVLSVELLRVMRHQTEGRLGVLPVQDLLATFPSRMLEFFRANPETASLLRREIGAEGRVMKEILLELGAQGPMGMRKRMTAGIGEAVAAGSVRDLPADHLLACLLAMSYGLILMEPLLEAVLRLTLESAARRGLPATIESLLRLGLTPREDA